MQTYLFREEDRPKFNIRRAGLISLVCIVLLLLAVAKSNPFELDSQTLEQIALEQQKQQRQSDMVFRFMDTPNEVEENPDPEFLSDANRIKKSSEPLTETPENNDPVSVGNSLELKQQPLPTVPSEPQPATPQRVPNQSQDQEPQKEEPTEEPPEEPEEPQETEAPKEPQPIDPTLDDPFAPKPYKKLSSKQRKDLAKKAEMEMMAQDRKPSGALTERYDNPNGSRANQTGFSIDTGGHDLGPYLNILKQLVKSNWRIPSIARYEVRGFSIIDFKLHKDGRITDAYIYTQSGYEPLDAASLNAITGIYKAPPLPKHIDEPFIPIKFGFYYNMRPRY